MKRIILVSIAFLLIAFTGVVFIKFIKSLRIKTSIQKEMNTIPDFKFYSMDSTEFTRDSLLDSLGVIFIHFHSNCEYCISEIEQIVENSSLLADVEILFISYEDIDLIKEFRGNYNLQNHKQIKMLKDSDNSYYRNFGTSVIPSIIIYDKNGNLVRIFNGEASVDAILKNL